ncbi:hypothetical protein B9T39_02100 [Alloscardovia macacae]|uniref:Uncharacterized protein n=2 Tax=Alloscardovia macacae TaxID=1160091 RepID=A0A1Y2T370_9BIFI|nr:hypothetical protein B9T39_02100 [Alloscardovia macacae]
MLFISEKGQYAILPVGPVFSHMTLWTEDGLYSPGFRENFYFPRHSSSGISTPSMHNAQHEYVLSIALLHKNDTPLYIEDLGFTEKTANEIILERPTEGRVEKVSTFVPDIVASCSTGLYSITDTTSPHDPETHGYAYSALSADVHEPDFFQPFTQTSSDETSIEAIEEGAPCSDGPTGSVVTFLTSTTVGDYRNHYTLAQWHTRTRTVTYTSLLDRKGRPFVEDSEALAAYGPESVRGDTFTFFSRTTGIIHQFDMHTGRELRQYSVGHARCALSNQYCLLYLFGQTKDRIVAISYGRNFGNSATIHILDAHTLTLLRTIPVSTELARLIAGYNGTSPSHVSMDPLYR